MPDAEVEEHARSLADTVTDPELVRRVTSTLRAETADPGMSVEQASLLEQQAQFWSMMRPSLP